MAEKTVFTFDLGEVGRYLDVEKWQGVVGSEISVGQGGPARILSVTREGERVKVAVEMDGLPELADAAPLGVSVPETGSLVVGEAAPGQSRDDV